MESVVTAAPQPGPAQGIRARLRSLGDFWLRPHAVDAPEAPAEMARKLRWLLAVVAVGDLVAAVYYFWHAFVLKQDYPYNTYLTLPSARFGDYFDMVLMCGNLNPYRDLARSCYPPFANLVFYLFHPFTPGFGLLLFLLPPFCFLFWAARRLLARVAVGQQVLTILFILFLGYPFLFALDRGNLELQILISLGVFFLFYNSQEAWRRDLASLGLAAGMALKLYPGLLLLLLLKDRRFSDCLKVLLIFELLTAASACAFVGGAPAALSDFREMLSVIDALVKSDLQYGHGNAGIFYGVAIVLAKLGWETGLEWFSRYYWLIGLLLLAGYSALIVRSRLSYWASTMCLVILMCLIPALSNDYRTVQLLIPLLLFVTARTPVSKRTIGIAVLLGVLLVPRNYWILFPAGVGIGGVITPLVLFALLNLILHLETQGGPEVSRPDDLSSNFDGHLVQR